MQRHLVLAGAGHCHLELLGRLEEYAQRGWAVTLISPGNFWYSGMGPGALSGKYRPDEHCVDTTALVRQKGGSFIEATVSRIDAPHRAVELSSGDRIAYDLLSLNIGSIVPTSMIEGAREFGWTVKPIENLTRLRGAVEAFAAGRGRVRVVIAGGGAAGCEIAINLWRCIEKMGTSSDIQIITPGSGLMAREGGNPGQAVVKEMKRLGIGIVFGRKVARAEKKQVRLDDGTKLACDFFVVATGVKPPPLIADSDLPTAADGSLLVNEHLQSVEAPEIFGAGDCIGFKSGPPPRVGVYAVRESKLLHHNLCASIDGKALRRFRTKASYLLILNMADGTGLLFWRGRAWRGRWAFVLKDFLDRRFVEKYRPG